MPQKEPEFIRTRDRIKDVKTGQVHKFGSISAAKQQSRHLQKSGKVVAVDHSEDPKPQKLDFGRKHRPVSFAEERRIRDYNDREARIRARRKIDASHVDIIARRLKVAP